MSQFLGSPSAGIALIRRSTLPLALLFALSAKGVTPSKPPDGTPVAITISGGVSLGSYEAGVNWGLLRILRETNQKLTVVTGASAGNINTLLTAFTWCGLDPDTRTPEQSLFWHAWVPVDLDQLLPREFETGYRKGSDGLFSRAPFQRILDELERKFAASANGCPGALALGITLSRLEPRPLPIRGANGRPPLEVPAMRYVVPFLARTEQGRLHLRAPEATTLSHLKFGELGLFLLPAAPGADIALHPTLEEYVLAGSAFPYAFGVKELPFWAPPPGAVTVADGDFKFDSALFLDGGIFDNVPLGLTTKLLGPEAGQFFLQASARARVVYIDPDLRRPGRPPPLKADRAHLISPPPPSAPLAGIGTTLTTLRNAVTSARDYELQAVARYENLDDIDLQLTSRTLNIFGEYLGNFSGFTEQKGRELDFYLGITDALLSEAEAHCLGPRDAACVVEEAVRLEKAISLPSRSPMAHYVFERVITYFFQDAAAKQGLTEAAIALAEASPNPQVKVRLSAAELKDMLDVLTRREYSSFTDLLHALQDVREHWSSRVIDDTDGYFEDAESRVLLRALALERGTPGNPALRLLDAANLVARSAASEQHPRLDPSTIPGPLEDFQSPGAFVGHLLPYYLGLEFPRYGEFGIRGQWRPTLPLGSRFRLTLPLDVGWMGPRDGWLFGGSLGTKLVAGKGFGLDASVGVGHWGHGGKVEIPLQFGVSILEALHLGVFWGPSRGAFTVNLGYVDINGIGYWMARALTGH